MFLGKETKRIDDKGRMAIPAKMRDCLNKDTRLVLSPSPMDPCLEVIPMDVWEKRVECLMNLSSADRDERQMLRESAYRTEQCSVDRQGRILIPAALRQHANLSTESVVLGRFDIMEIWDVETFAAEEARTIDPDKKAAIQQRAGL